MAFVDTLTQKHGPLPTWAWATLGTIALALILMRQKSKAAKDPNAAATQAAASQTSTDLGSAQELANLFNVAGLMPYQGGATYVNTTTTVGAPAAATSTSTAAPLDPTSLSGAAQVAYVLAHNKQQIGNDVQAAYNAISKAHGASVANSLHYIWHANGNVTATAGLSPADMAGIAQLNYVKAHNSAATYNAVLAAYNNLVQSKGAATANSQHYVYNGAGKKVTTVKPTSAAAYNGGKNIL